MEINKKNRTELKNYFLANKIPTQQQFADLIDACINQVEDGITKAQGSPLAIAAQGDKAGTQEVLHLYAGFEDTNPSWSINLNPWVNPDVPGSNKPGLNIKDGQGQSQLFIQPGNGNMGIGTIEPEARFSVKGRNTKIPLIAAISANSGKSVFEVAQEGENGILSVINYTGNAASRISGNEQRPSFFLSKLGVGTTDPQANVHVKNSGAQLRITNTQAGSSPRLALEGSNSKSWDILVNEAADDALEFVPNTNAAQKLILARNGNLQVPGGMTVKGFIKTTEVVAFSAYITQRQDGKVTVVKMEAFYNAGNHFDNLASTFTAPLKGLYLFTITMKKSGNDEVLNWRMRLNTTRYVNGTGDIQVNERATLSVKYPYPSHSRTILTTLNAGDVIHIEQDGGGYPDDYRSGWEGVLLQAFS